MYRIVWAVLLLAPFLKAGCVARVPAAFDRLVPDVGLHIAAWPVRGGGHELHDGDAAQLPAFLVPIGPAGRGFLYGFVEQPQPALGRVMLFVSAHDVGASGAGPSNVLRMRHPREGARELLIRTEQHVTFINIRSATRPGPSRGMAIYLTSMAGYSRPERALIEKLQSRGWDVLVVLPSTQVVGRLLSVHTVAAENIDSGASAIAARIDSMLAEYAYAVEAALGQMDEPDRRPCVLLGGSFGALAAPAVAAALEGRIDAAVLIAGGADVLRIVSQSPLGRDRFALWWIEGWEEPDGGRELFMFTPSKESLEALSDRVRSFSTLDPWNAAAGLRHVPVLQLHAAFDAVVPAKYGDLLHEQLGRPERWTYSTGHFGLFFLLGFETARVADWIEVAVER